MDSEKKTYFIVEIGGADFYFEKLSEASEFFAKLASTTAEKIDRLGYGSDAYYYKGGHHTPSMKQEEMNVYPNKKAAEFAKHNEDENEKEDD